MKVGISVDMSQMRGGLDLLLAAFASWPEDKQADFAERYRALSGAGAEWAEVIAGDTLAAVLSDDMRRLCAEFGLTL